MPDIQKLEIFQELITCNYKIGLTAYDLDMKPDDPTGEKSLLYDGLLEASHNKERILSYIQHESNPVVLSDRFGLVWIACFEKQNNKVSRIYLLGPAYTSENSLQNLKSQLDNHDFSVKLKKLALDKLRDIPVIMSNLYFQYAIMLHYCLTNETIQYSDIQYKSSEIDPISSPTVASNHHHGIWAAEQRLLSMVENGILNYREALSDIALLSYGIKFDVGNPLRHSQVSVHAFITLCCRAAIKGGLSSETAYSLADYYAQCVEKTSSVSETGVLSHTMYVDYITRVHRLKQDNTLSLPIQSCRDYIELHLYETIQIKKLAEITGYSEYYLTKKFKKELGISIKAYIQTAKIGHAKLLLTTTKDSIQEISDKLCFCSRSYFTDVFFKITGTSPGLYRENHLRL